MRTNRSVFSIVLFTLAGLVLSGCGSGAETTNNANNNPTTVDVPTAQVTIQSIPTYIEATGNLAGDESTDVAPNVSGKIVEVNFDVGSFVQQGSVLVRLDPRDAQIRLDQVLAQAEQQKKGIDQANANVNQAIASLRQTQARLGIGDGETFKIEDFSQVRETRAQLVLAERELERAARLLASGDVSQGFYDQKKAQRDQLLGRLDESRSNANVAIKAISTAQAQVESARAAAAGAKAAYDASEAQIAQARKGISDTNVYAPFSGYVSERIANIGQYISPNTPNAKIATIVRTSTLRLQIDIPEQEIGKVATGQGVSLQTSAYPDRSFAGTIARILPGLDETARTLTVEAEVQNVDGLLKPGQFATVRITQSKPEPAVMIPATAVKADGDVNKVYVIKEGVAREQFVQLGLLENNMIQVKQGVIEGDVVATGNLDALRDGVLVRQQN